MNEATGQIAMALSLFLMIMFARGLWGNRTRRRIFGWLGRIPAGLTGLLMPSSLRQRAVEKLEDELNYLNDPLRGTPERFRWLQGAGLMLGILFALSTATWLAQGREHVPAGLPGMIPLAEVAPTYAPIELVWTMAAILAVLLGTLGWFYPRLSLNQRVIRRKQRLLLQLADLLELMAITMRAGAEFDQSMETAGKTIYDRYTQKPDDYPLGIELAQALFERNMGVSRADFMESLGLRATMRKERNEAEFADAAVSLWDELTQAVTLSQELGSSLRDTLPDIVDRVRSGRLKAAEQTASTARVTIVYPQSLLVLSLMITLLAAVGLFISNLNLSP